MDDDPFESRPLFLYGLLDEEALTDDTLQATLATTGVHNQPVHLIGSQGLTVLGSPLPRRTALRASDADEAAYRAVIDAAFQVRTVLPLRFGTIADTRDAVDTLLRRMADTYRVRLRHLDGHAEMGVRMTLPDTVVQPAIDLGGPAYRADRPGTAYLLARQRKSDQDAARRRHAARPYRDRLDPLAVETHIARSPGDDPTVALAFLVRRDAVDAFRAAAQQVRSPGVRDVEVVGPGAPYSFV